MHGSMKYMRAHAGSMLQFLILTTFFGEPMKDIFTAIIIAAALTVCALAYFDVLVK